MDNKVCVLLVILVLSISCNSSVNYSKDRDETENEPTENVDSIILLEETKVDTSVSGISFENPNSVRANIANYESIVTENEGLPYAYVKNKDGNQYLKLTSFPGGGYYDIYQFEVGYTSELNNDIKLDKTEFEKFVTESGIHLGLSRDSVLKDKESIISYNAGDTIIFGINDYQSSSFLQHYNLPAYFGKYYFEKDILVKYHFGFFYP